MSPAVSCEPGGSVERTAATQYHVVAIDGVQFRVGHGLADSICSRPPAIADDRNAVSRVVHGERSGEQ
jgi:hypothetical protein